MKKDEGTYKMNSNERLKKERFFLNVAYIYVMDAVRLSNISRILCYAFESFFTFTKNNRKSLTFVKKTW